jgi:DNA gyrase subunit B/topoisomerase-4 subunit B
MAYTAKDITVLEGLDPVRRRPGMYIGGVGSSGLHHLVWEILDNSIDEAMNGHASNIWVILHKDGSSITIEDDGRGIPVDKHGPSKKSAMEVIFTVLHAGGKFDHDNYKTAGGLHGVGASVVNALSKELIATVRRDGAEWEQRFRQGKPLGPPKKIGTARGSGTKVFFHPDPAIFPKIELEAAIIRERLEVASYIHKGLKISFEDESEKTKETFEHSEGLLAYLRKIVGAVLAREAERYAGRPRLAMDRSDRRAHSQLRQWHPDRIWRNAREWDARRSRQGCSQLHRYA